MLRIFRLIKRLFFFGILAWALLFVLSIYIVKDAQRNNPTTQTSKGSATKQQKTKTTPRQEHNNTLFMR